MGCVAVVVFCFIVYVWILGFALCGGLICCWGYLCFTICLGWLPAKTLAWVDVVMFTGLDANLFGLWVTLVVGVVLICVCFDVCIF